MKITPAMLQKYTPLAPVIWKKEEMKKNHEEISHSEWISKLTNQIGNIAKNIEKNKNKNIPQDELEQLLTTLAALCLTWIETERNKKSLHVKKN